MTPQTFHLLPRPADLDAAVRRLEGAGRRVLGVVVTGRDDAQRAVLAALHGADLVIARSTEAAEEVIDDLVEDLRRLGRVREAPPVDLTAEQLALLAALTQGLGLGEAAAAVHLSRRTADRRLAEARAALGARTTAEALVAATRLGLISG